jgi:hypothetical protein
VRVEAGLDAVRPADGGRNTPRSVGWNDASASVTIMARTTSAKTLEERVVAAAEAALAEQHFVSAVDVFMRIGWLPARLVGEWRQGRVDCLEHAVHVNPLNVSSALAIFRRWAEGRGLEPRDTAYVARTRDRHPLRFTESGSGETESACRTHWVSAELSEKRRDQLTDRLSRPPHLVVVIPIRDWVSTACGGTGSFLFMERPGPLCLHCSEMDHLVFLPSGDATLTRRARKASTLSAVVVRFSRTRKRYERQGILVEEAALDQAEADCLADDEARRRRRLREEEQRLQQDVEFQTELAREIVRLFPGCPRSRAERIARLAGARGSGRVGGTAAGRALDPEAVTLAVAAAVRHIYTRYDELLMSGIPRAEARIAVRTDVEGVLERWRGSGA